MKRCVFLVAAVLPVVGCAVQPGSITGPTFVPPSIQFPGIVAAPVEVDPGVIVIDGASYDPVFVDGRWGYYDRYHHFRDAPERDRARLEGRYPGGRGYAGRGMGGRPGAPGHAAPGHAAPGHAAPVKAAPAKSEKKHP
jgi:hypothetical protein